MAARAASQTIPKSHHRPRIYPCEAIFTQLVCIPIIQLRLGSMVMNAISYRSTKVFGALVVLAAAALTGCAATGTAVTSGAAASRAAVPANFTAPRGYVVCSGGHASRFPELEKLGRVCRPGGSVQGIFGPGVSP